MTLQERAALEIVAAVGSAIHDLGQVPSGHLYARLMDRLTLAQYESIISTLIRAKMVKRDGNHLLTWCGPKVKES